MEEEIEMEMEDERVEVYEVAEFDFEYEYDAVKFFDFTRPESVNEARLSESWFLSAPDYPPSPFVAQLFPLNGLSSPNVDASPKSKYDDQLSMDDEDDAEITQQTEYYDQDAACKENISKALLKKICDGSFTKSSYQPESLLKGPSRGLTFYNHLVHDFKKPKSKSLAKPYLQKSSTLMKPTASQLAKQNQQRQVCGSRLQKLEGHQGTHPVIENQASKRQKLDGGQLRKIVNMKQPDNLIHKLPKKDVSVQETNSKTKLRITIPREPDLATAQRAERIRSNTKDMENSTATTSRFKARPFNKKIFEAPTLPFPRGTAQHLPDLKESHPETTGRTKQRTSTAASTPGCQTDKIFNKVTVDSTLETGKRDDKMSQVVHCFKARPLDQKILRSRGDIGVFRNNKRDVTVPKEFAFQTSKRTQHNLPTELFSKLSLAGESEPKKQARAELPPRTSIPAKGSKENRWESCHQNHQNMTYQAKEKRYTLIGKDRLTAVNGAGSGETCPRQAMSRPFGSWRLQ